jgi:hypothetical protein
MIRERSQCFVRQAEGESGMRRLIALVACLCLGACAYGYKKEVAINRPPPVNTNASPLAGARVCNVDSLAMQRSQYIETVRTNPLISGPPNSGAEVGKMKSFEAAIDGQYRTVVGACRAYIQCMEAHSYDEGACRMSEQRWSEAEREFSNLAVQLRPQPKPPKVIVKVQPAPAPYPPHPLPPHKHHCRTTCPTVASGLTNCCH